MKKQSILRKTKTIIALTALGLMSNVTPAQQSIHCATMNNLIRLQELDPKLESRMQTIETQTQQFVNNPVNKMTSTNQGTVYNIPVVVHVVYNTSAQNISDAQIQSQIDVLNEDYRRLNADKANTPSAFSGLASDCELTFCLAGTSPTGAATSGIIRKSTTVTSFTDDDAVKHSSTGGDDAWPASSYLNLWVCNLGGGLLGYAQFPGGAAATDGVVILYSSFGRTGNVTAPYNKGRTATHEVGHWLNLRHVWGDANCGDDLVSDTPTQQTSNFGCPSFPHTTCSNGTNGDMFMNYMDYTDDGCMNMFSSGQKARMKALFASGGARVSLLTSNGCGTTSSCGTPSGLSATSLTSSGATLNWTAVTGASGYNVHYKKTATTSWTSVTSTTNSKAISGLAASTQYDFQVQAVCGTTGVYSAPSLFTTSGSTTTTSSVTVTIGSGTGTTGVTPYGSYYMDERTQFIITQSELVANGWTSTDSYLRSLAFNVISASSQTLNGFTIKVANTTASSFTSNSFLAGTFTTVYSGSVTPVSNSWNTYNFSTAFNYNGTDNLLIEICWNNSSQTANSPVHYTATTDYRTLYHRADISSGGVCGNTTGTLTYNRPNMKLTFKSSSTGTSVATGKLGAEENNDNASITTMQSVSNVVMFPNPATINVSIEFAIKENKEITLMIFDLTGRVVLENKFSASRGDNAINVDVSTLEHGNYIIMIDDKAEGVKKRLMIDK